MSSFHKRVFTASIKNLKFMDVNVYLISFFTEKSILTLCDPEV